MASADQEATPGDGMTLSQVQDILDQLVTENSANPELRSSIEQLPDGEVERLTQNVTKL